jgi:predicted branched-subunit amino acid permease
MHRPWQDPAWRAEFRGGARDMLPAFPGIFAWGLVTGVAMVKGGLSVPMALLMSVVAYAGSAQLASLPLIAASAPVWIIAVTSLATNMRFVIYAAALRRWLVEYSRRRLAVLGYISGDFSFVLFMNRVGREGAFRHRDGWLFGLTLTNWLAWQVSSVLGVLAGAFIPADWGLQFAGTLALLALVVPSCTTWPGATGALVAGVVALAGRAWPYRLGLLTGVVVGLVVATSVEGRRAAATTEHRP